MIVNNDDGFVPIPRRLYSDRVFQNTVEASVFVWLVAMAFWRKSTVRVLANTVTLQRGQLIVSERELAGQFLLPKTRIHRMMNRWVAAGLIEFTSPKDQFETDAAAGMDRRRTIITIRKYDDYQSSTITARTATDRAGTGGGPGANQDRANGVENSVCDQEVTDIEKEEEWKYDKSMPNAEALGASGRDGPRRVGPRAPVHARSPKERLWRDGPAIVGALAGCDDASARKLIGKMLKLCADPPNREDPIRILAILGEAERLHPLMDAEGWLLKAARARKPAPAARPNRDDRLDGIASFEAMVATVRAMDRVTAYDIDLQPEPETIS